MRIHVYSVCWNEIRIIEFFLRHYESFAERIVVYDDDSDDGTREILAAHRKVEVRRLVHANPQSKELSITEQRNNGWKEARASADWIMVVDCDEHVFHPRLPDYLTEQKRAGATILPTLGFQMVTDRFPDRKDHLASRWTEGYPSGWYSKPCIFDPAAIEDINFEPGAHHARPTGRVKSLAQAEVMLLHYKYLGIDYLVQRYAALAARRGSVDIEKQLGFHMAHPPEEWRRRFANAKGKLVNVADRGFSPSAAHAAIDSGRNLKERG